MQSGKCQVCGTGRGKDLRTCARCFRVRHRHCREWCDCARTPVGDIARPVRNVWDTPDYAEIRPA